VNDRTAVAIIDSGGANINSIVFACERLGHPCTFTSDWDVIRRANRVILPGVGAARAAMDRLKDADLATRIGQLTQPVLGICLGMQLLFEHSEEGDTPCLGIIPATVRSLRSGKNITIPHTGWNRNEWTGECPKHPLVRGVPDGFFGYFVHGFAAPPGPWTVARVRHGEWFSSVAAYRNFCGIQFHPERSGEIGSRLLENFLRDDWPAEQRR
jgi:glutamine amidotransferase